MYGVFYHGLEVVWLGFDCCLFHAGVLQQMEDAAFDPGTLTAELLILATAANQLFQSTQYMSPDAQVRSVML